jgi:hypothetical protein
MDYHLYVCDTCGKAGEDELDITIVSGKEQAIGEDKNGEIVTNKIPDMKQEFTVCEDCYNKIAVPMEREYLIRCFVGLSLIPVSVALLSLPFMFVFDSPFLGVDLSGFSWFIRGIILLFSLVPGGFSVILTWRNLRYARYNIDTIIMTQFAEKYGDRVLAKLKKTDPEGAHFVCTLAEAANITSENDRKWSEVRTPFAPPDDEFLEKPCLVHFRREPITVSKLKKGYIYLNGELMGTVKSGRIVSFHTNVKNNVIFVTDMDDNVVQSTYRFVARSRSILTVRFNGEFISKSARMRYRVRVKRAKAIKEVVHEPRFRPPKPVTDEKRQSGQKRQPSGRSHLTMLVNDGTGRVIFVRERREGGYVWKINKASNKADAIEFLSHQHIHRPYFYVVVETPEGNFGKDEEGIYEEN